MRLHSLALGMALLAFPVAAEEAPECPKVAEPVISLGFGSRYTDDSANRSDFDEEGDKAVTAALKPIDTFITDLAKQTDILNDPEAETAAADAAASCVLDSIRVWAEADALSDLTTQGANLSAPSRVGGRPGGAPFGGGWGGGRPDRPPRRWAARRRRSRSLAGSRPSAAATFLADAWAGCRVRQDRWSE